CANALMARAVVGFRRLEVHSVDAGYALSVSLNELLCRSIRGRLGVDGGAMINEWKQLSHVLNGISLQRHDPSVVEGKDDLATGACFEPSNQNCRDRTKDRSSLCNCDHGARSHDLPGLCFKLLVGNIGVGKRLSKRISAFLEERYTHV